MAGLLQASAPAADWVDAGLPVNDGLQLWLDAARQPAARQAHGRDEVRDGERFDVWYDGCGQRRHLVQRVQAAQPRFHAAGSRAVVRFDGQDDHLALAGVDAKLKQFTAIIVAAPRSNPGFFRAFLAANETGKNDYTTGFTIDQNGGATEDFSAINVEGAGFSRAMNLMRQRHPFGAFRLITATADDKQVRLFIDGVPQGTRPRQAGPIAMDQITLGARFLSNTQEPPHVNCHLQGDIAEVLLFDRALNNDERAKVEQYLLAKHDALFRLKPGQPLAALAETVGVPLEREPIAGESGIPVRMFVPGFTVRELPVKLTNINNLRYRRDGKLVALGYDGRVHLLTDTDDDGLEDKATIFWDQGELRGPIGMALTPPNYKYGDGVFVASKGKVSLIVDTDGDDKADKEIIVTTWKPSFHNVDGVGVAIDDDGAVYFGIGCVNFADPYLLGDDGKAKYDVNSHYGTIQKVSPDFKTRETICTGVRFSIGMAFNREGDLFVTDQEGATWLPGGNPLDELLHIQRGKHYGFPPRHETHLPNVVDAPAVETYGPQHQSTCGFVFNEHWPAEQFKGWKHFGPAFWKGDALITGQSRGKIYRTKLTKTDDGYSAQTQIIAALGMLTVDVCVSPAGDLLVACHSGPPDWGTGPKGEGRLFKISNADARLPQPVRTRAVSPVEVHVEFDRPLDPSVLPAVAKGAAITYGEYVRAGDRFEWLKPPYEVVKQQEATPRFALRVAGASLSDDRRTLKLRTDPHPALAWYAIELPGVTDHVIDVDYSLFDVKAKWAPTRRALVEAAQAAPDVNVRKYAGGNWLRGREVYRNVGKCASCHELRGEGRAVGPDLSNLGHRDVGSIVRDIVEPNVAINPDHVTYIVTLDDGGVLTGVLRTLDDGKLRLTDAQGNDTLLDEEDIASFRPSALSTMPSDIAKQLSDAQMRDLITYLRTPPPTMPRDYRGTWAAPQRTKKEVEALLAGAPGSGGTNVSPGTRDDVNDNANENARPLHIVLVAGPKDHGPGEHDYPAWQKNWARLLEMADGVKVSTAWEWPSAEQFKTADAMVFYQRGSWSEQRAKDIDAFLARGGGLTYIHWAVDGGANAPEFARRIGLAAMSIKFRHGPLDLVFNTDTDHPIVRNFDKVHFHDESYWKLTGDRSRINTLATGVEEGEPRPLFWTVEQGKGRVFVSILGHYSWTFDDPAFRVLLLRGMLWTARRDVDRLNELVTVGVPLKGE